MADVQSYIDDVQAYSEELRGVAEETGERLENFTKNAASTIYGFADTDFPDLYRAAGAEGVQVPSMEKAALNYDPSSLDPGQYTSAIWSSEFFGFALPIIKEQITNGGAAIKEEVQDALFNHMRERDLQAMNDALDVAESNIGRRNFPLPSSLSQAARQEVIKQYQEKKENQNREITALMAERAQNGMLALMDKGIDIERAQMDFAKGFATTFIQLGNQVLQAFQTEQQAYVSEFEGQIRGVLAKLEVAKVNQQSDTVYNEQILKRWQTQAEIDFNQTKEMIAQAEHYASLRIDAAKGLMNYLADAVASAHSQINTIVAATSGDE